MISRAVVGWVGFVGLVTWVGYRWQSALVQADEARAHTAHMAEQSQRMMLAATLEQQAMDDWDNHFSRPTWLDMDETAE